MDVLIFSQLLLFCPLLFLSWHQTHSAWLKRRTNLAFGEDTRPKFMLLLTLSLLTRVIFIILEAFVSSTHLQSHGIVLWFRVLSLSLPNLIFISACCVIILFWLDIYLKATLLDYPLLRLSFVYVNVFVYSLFTVVALVCLLRKSYAQFKDYSLFFIGVCFILIAVGLLYCGYKVVHQLEIRSLEFQSSAILLFNPNYRLKLIKRIRFLYMTCPFLLTVKGLYGIISSFRPYHNNSESTLFFHRTLWDFLISLFTEWLPTLLILLTFTKVEFPIRPWPAGWSLANFSSFQVSSNQTDSLNGPTLQSTTTPRNINGGSSSTSRGGGNDRFIKGSSNSELEVTRNSLRREMNE